MKKALVLVLFSISVFYWLGCNKPDPAQTPVAIKLDTITSQKEIIYIEKDPTTAYLGQGTIKLNFWDTTINSACASSFVKFQNLTQQTVKINFSGRSIFVDANKNSVQNLCELCPFSECPNKEALVSSMTVKYGVVMGQTTSQKEVIYIEKDSTTAYLGQGTIKLNFSDTVINSACASSFVKFQNLTQRTVRINFSGRSIIVYANTNAVQNLCELCPSSECPNKEAVVSSMTVKYDTNRISRYTGFVKYIEKDSATAFLGQETLKLTISTVDLTLFSAQIGWGKPSCQSNLLEVENLTDKNVKVVFYSGVAPAGTFYVEKTLEIPPRQKASEQVNVRQLFSCIYSCCPDFPKILSLMKVTYN